MKKAVDGIVTVTKSYIDNSGTLFEFLKKTLGLKNDADLSRWLKVAHSDVSRIRHGQIVIGASMILFIHEAAGIPVASIRGMIAGEVAA